MVSRIPVVLIGLLALVLSSVGPTLAQKSGVTIIGSVVDAALNPMASVLVVLERNGQSEAKATTNAAGEFRFANVAPGAVKVRVNHTGYPAFARDVTVPASATTMRLPIALVRPQDKAVGEVAGAQARSATVAGAPPPPAYTPPPPAGAVAAGGAGGRGGAAGTVRTETPVVSQTIGADFVQSLPRADRNALTYMTVVPGETYDRIEPNRFHATLDRPLSTFAADVDTASYSNIRRFLSSGQLPPREAVRLEELVNYFRFPYAQPRGGAPIAISTEIGDCPWAPSHKLVLIGARAAAPATREITGRNIVLLIDVSGSMQPAERLPMIKTALGLFVDTLRPDDTLAIVTYAGTSGIALHPTRARQRDTIQHAIASLNAGGSTNGGSGLILAYRTAREAYMPGGVNRVILATDGDFNVGVTSHDELLRLIERERESGVFLSVLGVGSGNLKDATMEMLADKGNGNYSYLDSLQEARRVLIREGDATIEAVAKDVKFQVEFNPAVVASWKLLGYENRALAARDFNNDRKDAGEMGAGHTVTALYEIVPVGVDAPMDDRGDERPSVDPLKYQPGLSAPNPTAAATAPGRGPGRGASAAVNNGEWLTVKTRFKQPEGETSELITTPVRAGARTQFLPLASAVAEFALLLRDAPRNDPRWDALARRVDQLAVPASLASEVDGFRELVATARGLARLR